MEKVETTILRNLIFNEEYVRKVLPYLKIEYFQDYAQKVIFFEIFSFVSKYNKLASKEALLIEVDNRTDLNETSYKEVISTIESLEDSPAELQWLIDTTEKWCRDRAIYLALMESIQIADGNDEKKNRDSIPSILSDALAVSFDNHIGHDYLNDYEERYEFYQKKEEKIPFDLEYFNKITKGGLSRKTMLILMASTGAGKSLALCHMASSVLLQGKNVLYITMEMSEEKIAERIDANLLNVDIKDLPDLPKSVFDNKVNSIVKKTQGSLIIKEYPTASAHVGHFKSLLNELALKKSFVPDFLIVDYMNICSSSRYKNNIAGNSYGYIKSIAEELRGLAVEFNVPLATATQVNRCLGLDTLVKMKSGNDKQIKDLQVGEEILSHSGYVTVDHIFPVEKQDVYEITTKSGKKILCSANHIFPTTNGEKNINTGLSIGDSLFVIKREEILPDEIVSIKKIGEEETIDITVSGDNLFFANGILTHNSGMNNSDIDLTDTSESIGGPMTADLLLALISTQELEEMNQIMVKQLKNRYADPTVYKKFVIGIDRAKMRLYDVDQSAQNDILDSGQEEEYNDEVHQPDLKQKFRSFTF